ncbi:hypothetical protein DDB_G0294174 [Dictyostelium discoideum AX4]|nr:hypothetical protein DDB_G0294174 [Dictyostelium discoideum AX4]EAL60398.1 hypothetical protein DDB_G0294174 [Dictyostelium discoideum AX4]|eukprot:XP_628811.1 hypothetical protein DDB_G0294174 [Dictyostelium discoideum AX4]
MFAGFKEFKVWSILLGMFPVFEETCDDDNDL